MTALPSVGIWYDSAGVDPLKIARASSGRWRTVWVLDGEAPVPAPARRILERFGSVVDLLGLGVDERVETLRASRLRGFLALNDRQLIEPAPYAWALALPYFSADSLARLTNKLIQRRALAAAGLPNPGFWQLTSTAYQEQRDVVLREAAFPVVIKPTVGSASRDTIMIDRPQDWPDELARDICASRPCIVEEYLQDSWSRDSRPFADYVSVESLYVDSKVRHVVITGTPPLVAPFRETGAFIPAFLPDDWRDQAYRMTERAILALAQEPGVFHTEIKFTPSGPRIIEVNGRLGGGKIAELIEDLSGVSMLQLAAAIGMGETVRMDAPITCRAIGFSIRKQSPMIQGRVRSVSGLDEIHRLDGVTEVQLTRQVGEQVDWREGSAAVVAVRGEVADYPALWRTFAAVEDLVEIDYDVD